MSYPSMLPYDRNEADIHNIVASSKPRPRTNPANSNVIQLADRLTETTEILRRTWINFDKDSGTSLSPLVSLATFSDMNKACAAFCNMKSVNFRHDPDYPEDYAATRI